MSCFEINATRVPDGTNSYSFAAHAHDLELPPSFPDTVTVGIELERRGRQFFAAGDVRTIGRFICDRCLTDFDQDLSGTFSVLFTPEGAPLASERQDDEVRVMPSETMVIILDEDVRQCIELAVPVKLLCAETCKGLCPQCGKNLNEGPCTCERDDTDPRWEPLRKLSRS